MSTGRPIWSFVASLKRISSTSDFIHIFSWFNKCIQPQVWGRQPKGTKFLCQQKPLVTSVICYRFQKISDIWFYTNFFKILYMYIAPRQGLTTPWGWHFYVNRNILSLWSFFASLKKISFEVLILYNFFFMILYMYIALGQVWGRQPPGDKVLMSTETSCHYIHLLQVSNKCVWSPILYNFFHDLIHVYSPGAGADNPQGTKFWC